MKAVIDRRTQNGRLAFDLDKFHYDLLRACRDKGTNRRKLAVEIGVSEDTLYFITTKNAIPSTVAMAAICKWGGLDIGDYSIDLEGA